MRDDPIVYEDWEVGFSSYYNPQSTKYLDLIISILISLVNFYIGWYYEISFIIFMWTFIIIIVIVFEGLFDQKNRSSWDKALVFLGLVTTHFISSSQLSILNRFDRMPSYHLTIGILLGLKLILIPITESKLSLSENILIPRNKAISDFLNDQVKRLESTEYQLDTKVEFETSLNKLQQMILYPFIISLSIILFFNLLLLINIERMTLFLFPIFIGIMLLNGITLSAVLLIAYLEKRRIKKQERQKRQKIEDEKRTLKATEEMNNVVQKGQ